MFNQILHASQWCYRKKLRFCGHLFEKMLSRIYSTDISGRAKIDKHVAFGHGGLGVVIHPDAVIGSGCLISARVTIGNDFPKGTGVPTLGKNVYIGVGAYVGGGIKIADNVVIGANSVVTKDILEPGVVVAGVPGRILRKLTEEEIQKLQW